MSTTIDQDLRSQLTAVQAAVSFARNERALAHRQRDEAKAAFTRADVAAKPNVTSDPRYTAAQRAVEAAVAADDKLAKATEAERGVLTLLSNGGVRTDGNGPHNADHAGDGWAHAAHRLDLPGGITRLDMPASSLLHPPALAALNITPSTGLTAPSVTAAFVQKGQDRRLLYPAFARQNVAAGDLAITEYKQTGARTVTGAVERDPVARTEKANLALAVTLETPSLKQFAAVVDHVPAKLFDAIPPLAAFLQSELRYQLDRALDAHVLAQITAAAPPTGLTGATLIEQARNGVAAMRALGASPTILALNPADAASLDVQTSGADDAYIFATRDTGAASPLWGLTVLETPTITTPTLIDPALLGVVYAATGTVLIDPFSAMSTNEVRVRVEIDGLFHVRDIAGAYTISA